MSNMGTSSIIIIACFTIMGIYLAYLGVVLRNKGFKPLGSPTIKPVYFYTGKITLFSSWIILLVNSIMVMAGQPSDRIFQPWPAAVLVFTGTLMMIFAFRDLGDALRVGLPGEATSLKTLGIYRVSRNPIYVGVDLIAIGSMLFFPGIINIALALTGIAVHHAIILSEEQFLEGRFGQEWLKYKQKTRRYI